MSWLFHDLDRDIRARMVREFEQDVAADTVFVSRVVHSGRTDDYLDAHRVAFETGDPSTFEANLLDSGMMRAHRDDGARVNQGASARLLAGSQFGVYYARAVAQSAVEQGTQIEVYRARESSRARSSSEFRIGEVLDPAVLLADLRENSDQPGNFSSLPEVGSGLLVRRV